MRLPVALQGRKRHMIVSDTVVIAAPVGVVWRVTADVERWPEWTPTVTHVQLLVGGDLDLGSVASIKQPLQPVSNWIVVEFEEERRFAWETHRPGLRMKGLHELVAAGDGTRNTLTVEATGFLAVLLWPLLRFAVRKSLRDENVGLKRRCEREAGQQRPRPETSD
jgi:uncharacterized membrane protein